MTVPAPSPNPQGSPIQDLLAAVGPLRELIDIVWWTDAVPRSYKWSRRDGDFPQEKTKALMLASALLGNAMGVDPFRSWANIHPTGQGRFAIAADFKVGLALAAGCEIETVKRTADECKVRGRRRGGEWQEIRLTIDDARKAGWATNNLYDKVPGDMLYHRASGRMADMLAAHVTLGIVTYEDYADIEGDQVRALSARSSERSAAAIEGLSVRRSGGAPIADLIRERTSVDTRPEDSPQPPETPTERVRQARSAEKSGIDYDDPDGGFDLPGTALTVVEEYDETPMIAEATKEEAKEIAEELRRQGQADPAHADVYAAEAEIWEDADHTLPKPTGTVEGELVPESIPDDPATWPKVQKPDEPMITSQRWDEINGLFNRRHDINGEGSRAARMKTVKFVIGRTIENGRELTAKEGDVVYDFLTENTPERIRNIAWHPARQEEGK